MTETAILESLSKNRIISGFWRRSAAFLLDGLILGLIGALSGMFLFKVYVEMGAWGRLFGFGIALLYFGFLNSSVGGGKTLGKRMMKIEVVNASGNHISLGRSFFRYSVLGIPFFLNGAQFTESIFIPAVACVLSLLIFGGLGSIFYLFIFNRETRQSLHDLAASTYVVKTSPAGSVDCRPVWKLHFGIVAALLVATIILPIPLFSLLENDFFKNMLSIQQTVIRSAPQGSIVSIHKSTTSWHKQDEPSTTTTLTIRLHVKDMPEHSQETAADIIAALINTHPEEADNTYLSVCFNRGYDIGIAHANITQTICHKSEEWKNIIESGGTATNFKWKFRQNM